MVLSVFSRAWRAGIVACGVAWFGSADSRAETPVLSASIELMARSAEPFGLAASSLTAGGLRDKWLGVLHRLDDEMVQLALCEGDRERCASPAALKFLDIVDAAKAPRRPRPARRDQSRDQSRHQADERPRPAWPDRRLDVRRSRRSRSGGGDCEDYAIAKFVALRRAGIAPEDLRIVVLHDTIHGDNHAVAAARLDGRWLMLDNRRMAMVEDSDVRNYQPTFVIDGESVRRYEAAPMLSREDRLLVSKAAIHSGAETSPM